MSKSKIQNILKLWPDGAILTQSWLNKNGVSKQLSNYFTKSGWLDKVGVGAYKKANNTVSWVGGVFAIQHGDYQLVHIGGLTALELMGESHFVPRGQTRVDLFNGAVPTPKRSLPKWLTSYFNNVNFSFNRNILFNTEEGIIKYKHENLLISISSSERAILEILSLVPEKVTLEHAFLIVENKYNLRDDLLQELLECCTSILTKRLFLHLAKRCELPCFSRINVENINIGSRILQIGMGEEYDPEFKIITPKIKADDKDQEVIF
jgi:hypothetical protein